MISCDTNLLIYAYDRTDLAKRHLAVTLGDRLIYGDSVLAGQVCSEFLNAVRKKRLLSIDAAKRVVEILDEQMSVVEACFEDRIAAIGLTKNRGLQFYDALLCSTLARAGVKLLLSEDMTDGDTYNGVTVVNPFNPANRAVIDSAFVETGA